MTDKMAMAMLRLLIALARYQLFGNEHDRGFTLRQTPCLRDQNRVWEAHGSSGRFSGGSHDRGRLKADWGGSMKWREWQEWAPSGRKNDWSVVMYCATNGKIILYAREHHTLRVMMEAQG